MFGGIPLPTPDVKGVAIVCEPWVGDGWQPLGGVGLVNVDLDPLQRSTGNPPPRIAPSTDSTVYVSVIARWAGQEFLDAYTKCVAGGPAFFGASGTVYVAPPSEPMAADDVTQQTITIPIQHVDLMTNKPGTTVPVSCQLVPSEEFEQWQRPNLSSSGGVGG